MKKIIIITIERNVTDTAYDVQMTSNNLSYSSIACYLHECLGQVLEKCHIVELPSEEDMLND